MHTPGLLGADKGGPDGERQAEEENDRDRRTVEEAFKRCKLCERHDKVPWFRIVTPGGAGGVRSGRCLDSIYLNGVNMIFTSFG